MKIPADDARAHVLRAALGLCIHVPRFEGRVKTFVHPPADQFAAHPHSSISIVHADLQTKLSSLQSHAWPCAPGLVP